MRKDIHEYYHTLGLNPGATPAEIKRAYRQLIQRWHPDHFKSGSLMQTTAEDLTKEINEAYEQLIKKQLHRKFSARSEPRHQATPSPFSPPPGSRRRPERPGTRPATAGAGESSSPPAAGRSPRRPWRLARWPWLRLAAALLAGWVGFKVWQNRAAFASWNVPGKQFKQEVAATVSGEVAASAAASRRATPEATRVRDVPASPRPAKPKPAERGDTFALPTRTLPVAVPVPTAEWDRLFEAAAVLLKTFERGDSRARVIAVQGSPDESGENVIRYGSSLVYFRDGLVTDWINRLPRLRVRSMTSPGFDLLETFAVGSSVPDVERLQGRPGASVFDAYFYGSSVVRFEGGRVSTWTEGSESLRTPLLPASSLIEVRRGDVR